MTVAVEEKAGPTLNEQIAALKVAPMTDEELGDFLGLPRSIAQVHVAKITPEERACYEQMRAVEILAPLWQSGVEPYPSDVSVNRGRQRKSKRDRVRR